MYKRKRQVEVPGEVHIPASRLKKGTLVSIEDRVSRGGRTVKRAEVQYSRPKTPEAASTSTFHPDHVPSSTLDFDFSSFTAFPSAEEVERYLDPDEDVNYDLDEAEEGGEAGERRFATLEHDGVLRAWSEEVHKHLRENLRLEGLRGQSIGCCPSCCVPQPSNTPRYRCSDCHAPQVVCGACCIQQHIANPFHRIQEWNGLFFEKTTLQSLGLVIQLGHNPGEACPAPTPSPRASMVIDTNGFHPVNLQYCQCSQMARAGDTTEQLIRAELVGATLTDPSTFCTVRVLDHFHLLTLQSKITVYDFYMTLQKLTDIAGIRHGYNRLRSFLRLVREWRYLKLLKRAGRGHLVDGTKNIKPGELCLQCPACPRPGVNLPENWDTVSDDLRFIYTLIIAIDANFRLKRRAISNDARDPGLMSGLGYFVADEPYRNFILRYADQEDISSCTGFAAMANANTKFNRGYASTGVGLAICARHGIILPNGVGDLQKGERFCNMDYISMSALALLGHRPPTVLSYDIACQWEVHLRERVAAPSFPLHLQIELPRTSELRFVIPKYHFWGHTGENHSKYSLNLVKWVGWTDGEEVERNWWRHDGTAASTREMGPGSRHDTLEDHFQWSNFEKIIGLGSSLAKRQKRSTAGYAFHGGLWREFSIDIPEEDIKKWTASIELWEADTSLADPYYVAPSGMTENQVKAKLAEEEDEEAAQGNPALHRITPSSMIAELLEIEELQRRFLVKYPVVTRETCNLVLDIVDRRGVIRRRLQAIREIQAIYMPCVPQLIARQAQPPAQSQGPSTRTNTARLLLANADDQPERQNLFLPHQLSTDDLDGCVQGLADAESRLRNGQLHSALDSLRVQLHIRSRLLAFKAKNSRHQRENQRSREKIDSCGLKIKQIARKYRTAREAKLALCGPGDWEREWRVLADRDIRGLSEMEPQVDKDDQPLSRRRQITEGRRVLSWIWLTAAWDDESSAVTAVGMNEALRVEWLRARSRALRFKEDLVFVNEEQRRVLVTLERTALEWDRRAAVEPELSPCPIVVNGLAAYAAKQASLSRSLCAKFKAQWNRGVTEVMVDDVEDSGDGACLRFARGGDESDDEPRQRADDNDDE